MRTIAEAFVAAPPAGVRVRTRLMLSAQDAQALVAVGTHLGSLAGRDLARRCREGRLDAGHGAQSRRERKQALTFESSSRWAGAITRTSEDAWQLGQRNLVAEKRSLDARIGRIRQRLVVAAGQGRGRLRGYATQGERFEKQRRLQVLSCRLAEVDARLGEGRVSICRGGKGLARARHHLEEAELTEADWGERWRASRLFVVADGEKDKAWGNETIRLHPEEHWVEVKLPAATSDLANRPHGRYRRSCPVAFPYRGEEVAAQAGWGAIRYDIAYDCAKRRWYLDGSWRSPGGPRPSLGQLRRHPVLAVDVNAGHLAAVVVDPSGNPVGAAVTIAADLRGLGTSARDGHLRAAISGLLRLARSQGCEAVVIEDLDFQEARESGREHSGRRPSRGVRGRAFRRLVSGIPTAKFRDRLTQMASNAALAVVAVDPAYTSRWGAQHWLGALKTISPDASGHHAAALVIGRRGLKQRARRRERCASTPPEDAQERAANSAVWATPADAGLVGPPKRESGARKARGQPRLWQKTQAADRRPPDNQVAQDRSGPPTGQDSVLLSV